jgi:hypothetical protein
MAVPASSIVKNFAKVEVSGTYSPSDTAITLKSGDGATLPDTSTDGKFHLSWWLETTYPDPADDPNREIVEVSSRSGDSLTVVRGQLGTSGTTKALAGTYKMAITPTTHTYYNALFYNVKFYGAKGDGATTDTTAIQNAINAANAEGGGVVYFPEGSYNSDQLSLYADITLQGAGKEVSRLIAKTAGATDFLVNASTVSTRRNVQLRDLELQLSTSGNAATTLMRFCNIAYSSIRDCRFDGNDVGSSIGLDFDAETSKTTYYNIVDGCIFVQLTTGVKCQDRANSQRITNNTMVSVTTGITIDESNQILFSGNTIQTYTTGVSFVGATPNLTQTCMIFANRFESGTTGISIAAGTYSSAIIGNHFSATTNEYVDNGAGWPYLILEDNLNSLALVGQFSQWMRTPSYSSAFPAAASTYDRVLLHDPQSGSTPAKIFACLEVSSGSYAWREIVTSTEGLGIEHVSSLGSSNAYRLTISGETDPRLRIEGDGTINWGDGAGATDLNLYRSQSNTLKTDGAIVVGSGTIVLGTDTSFFRSAANYIKSNDSLEALKIHSKEVPWVDVTTYGATGDGTTDDTTAIQAAIDAAPAGSVVYFPDGTYKSDNIDIPTTGITLQGSRWRKGSTLQQNTSAGSGFITTDTSSGEQKGWGLKDLQIFGDGTSGHVIEMKECKGAEMDHVYIAGPSADYACLRVHNDSRSNVFKSVRVENSDSVGSATMFWIGDYADSDPLTTNNFFYECGSWNLGAADRITGRVIQLDQAASCRFVNCKFDGVESDIALLVRKGGKHSFFNVGFESPTAGKPTTYVELSSTGFCRFDQVTVADEATNGIDINNSHHIQWDGGLIKSDVDIDSNSSNIDFRRVSYTGTNIPMTWGGEAARTTTRVEARKISSADAPLAEFKTSETPIRYTFFQSAGGTPPEADVIVTTAESSGSHNVGQYYFLPFDGVLVGMMVELSSDRSSGTLTVQAKRPGAGAFSDDVKVVFDTGSPDRQWVFYENSGTHQFSQGDHIQVQYSTDTGWDTVAGWASTEMRVSCFIIRRGETTPSGSAG